MTPNKSLLTSIKNSKNTADLTSRLGEVALDQLLNQGVLREIPVIGTAITLWQSGNDIGAYFFAKKIVTFLGEVESVPQDKRKEFIEKNCETEEGIEHIGEATLMLLEKMDSPILATLLGRAFRLMLTGRIPRSTFEHYAHIIRNLSTYLIRELKDFYQQQDILDIEPPAAIELSGYGLVDIGILPNRIGNTSDMERQYRRTEFGKFFYQHVIKDA